MPTEEFLLEIGTEEIPAWMIEPALADLSRLLSEAFTRLKIAPENGGVETHATPRRLVAFVPALPDRQPDSEELLTGPPKAAPPQAAESFARKVGAAPAQLTTTSTPKGEYWAFRKKEKGRKTVELLQTVLPEAVLGIHFPKTMYWTGKAGPRFIRPIRWLVALYGGRVVPFEIAGVAAGKNSAGHRSLGKPKIKAGAFAEYVETLRQNGVVLRAAERRQKILADAQAVLPGGFRLRDNPHLLETLVYLTEFPTADSGEFDRAFLDLPEEVLETVMLHHQKYFSVSDASGWLAPRFVFVMNRDADPDGVVRHGNERVLRARFNDARFFWNTDQKVPLRERLPMLESVTFHARLGSYAEKTSRTIALVERIAKFVSPASVEHARRAAELAKCDLTTELVKEFTELQGVVGGLYARAQGESPAAADAIYDHYKPESMEDRSPRTPEGALLALADKLDTLAGCFGIGMKPKGSSDPFALRRAAQGVVKILADHGIRAPVSELITAAQPPAEAAAELRDFFTDRLRYYLREVRGYAYDEVNAVLAVNADDVVDALERAAAIARVRPTANFEPLSAAFKRIRNILGKAGGEAKFSGQPNEALLETGAEAELYHDARRVLDETRDSRDYEAVLRRIADLRPRVDAFFDKVLVMAKEEDVRQNRLTLLAWLLRAFTRIADFSEIVISREEAASRETA